MKLIDYLRRYNMISSDFARQIDASHSNIYEITYRDRKPAIGLACQIEAATHGLVTVLDLRGEIE